MRFSSGPWNCCCAFSCILVFNSCTSAIAACSCFSILRVRVRSLFICSLALARLAASEPATISSSSSTRRCAPSNSLAMASRCASQSFLASLTFLRTRSSSSTPSCCRNISLACRSASSAASISSRNFFTAHFSRSRHSRRTCRTSSRCDCVRSLTREDRRSSNSLSLFSLSSRIFSRSVASCFVSSSTCSLVASPTCSDAEMTRSHLTRSSATAASTASCTY